jgi:hypothetical protein
VPASGFLELEDNGAFEKSGWGPDKIEKERMEKVSLHLGVYMPIISKPVKPPVGEIE